VPRSPTAAVGSVCSNTWPDVHAGQADPGAGRGRRGRADREGHVERPGVARFSMSSPFSTISVSARRGGKVYLNRDYGGLPDILGLERDWVKGDGSCHAPRLAVDLTSLRAICPAWLQAFIRGRRGARRAGQRPRRYRPLWATVGIAAEAVISARDRRRRGRVEHGRKSARGTHQIVTICRRRQCRSDMEQNDLRRRAVAQNSELPA
jgi:hypothetical protein